MFESCVSGCKNFASLIEFGSKPEASKCGCDFQFSLKKLKSFDSKFKTAGAVERGDDKITRTRKVPPQTTPPPAVAVRERGEVTMPLLMPPSPPGHVEAQRAPMARSQRTTMQCPPNPVRDRSTTPAAIESICASWRPAATTPRWTAPS